MKLRLLPYKIGSRSARFIARALNGLRVRFDGRYRPRPNHLLINWGTPRTPTWWRKGLNQPQLVNMSANKKLSLAVLHMAGIPVPEFTTDIEVAHEWIRNGKVVVGRRILNGHGGIGCVVYAPEFENILSPLPLYTKHLRHKDEYRIHVFKGQVIDYAKKRKRRGFAGVDPWIRSYNNGWVFCREGIQLPDGIADLAIKSVAALGLDFGAVDIGYRQKEAKGYVFEVNTAPGMQGTTIMSYINAIRTYMRSIG